MKKFEVGNLVKVVKTDNGQPKECLGKEGKVIKVYEHSDNYSVEFDEKIGGSTTWHFKAKEIT